MDFATGPPGVGVNTPAHNVEFNNGCDQGR